VIVTGMLIGRSLTPLNSSTTLRAVRRRTMVRRTVSGAVTTTRAGQCRMSVEAPPVSITAKRGQRLV
jgi:hypothetical protein